MLTETTDVHYALHRVRGINWKAYRVVQLLYVNGCSYALQRCDRSFGSKQDAIKYVRLNFLPMGGKLLPDVFVDDHVLPVITAVKTEVR